MTTKSAGYFVRSGGCVANPFAASIKTIQRPLLTRKEENVCYYGSTTAKPKKTEQLDY
uniref:Molybdenum cofactor sulfurase isoform X2 n=1 Tax=Rhizophora mucronata TaxID=61149 RepID=A0A2P2KJ85_RHIMU